MFARVARGAGARVRAAHDTGDLYIALGTLGLCGAGAFAWREADLAAKRPKRTASSLDHARDLEAVRVDVAELQQAQEAAQAARRREATFTTAKPIFQAEVRRRVHPALAFEGPLALQYAKVGQHVAVLEADTGPDGGYHRCRNAFGEGLYPKAHLARLDETAKE